jgi:hypothetical protein
MAQKKEKFEVRIAWGSRSHRERKAEKRKGEIARKAGEPEPQPMHYKFDTQAELDAFLKGVDDAVGYMDYALLDEDGEES